MALVQNQLLLFCVHFHYASDQLLMAPVDASWFAFGMVPSLFLVSLEGMPSPETGEGIRNVLLTVWRFLFTNVCVILPWQVAIFLLVPLSPLKRCHHSIAGNGCLGTSSWLCPRKQTVISSESSEVSPRVFD